MDSSANIWQKNVVFAAVTLLGLVGVGYLLSPQQVVDRRLATIVPVANRAELQGAIQQLEAEFAQYWREQNLAVAPPAPWHAIVRRLALGLMGTLPSVEELRALERLPESDRVNHWLEHVLEDGRTHDYFAERMARALVGVENGPFLIYRRRRFVSWLSDQIEANVPYDRLVYQILADQGLWTDTPAVNFVSVTSDQNQGNQPDPIRLAGRTSRAFLGLRIDCLQCHDDFLGTVDLGTPDRPRGGTQEDFHQLAAFFSQLNQNLGGVRDSHLGKQYEYQFLDETETRTVAPRVPFGEDWLPAEGTRRQQLAGWVVDKQNLPFARATVNRLWAQIYGRPLVEPVDSVPLFGPWPPGMDFLSRDFVEHGFDLRRLIRLIALSPPFQLDSRADFEIGDEHEAGWSVFPVHRLRPEQVAGAIIQATSLSTIDSDSSVFTRLARFGGENDFVQRYGDVGEEEFEPRGSTVTQRLLLMNGSLIRQRLSQGFNSPAQIAIWAPSDQAMIESAFLATLTRLPDADEMELYRQRMQGLSRNKKGALIEDLFWVLLNSSEFTWNH